MSNNQKPVFFILLLILGVGFVLRFWDFWNMPFMFDELSAMGRTNYENFQDLIQFGVVERDSHPAGVQVFLFYWVKLFGDAEPVVKLPFLLAGMLSIWLSYKIGKLWFGTTTGLLTASFVSSLQLFVMYSQIARPYVSGLLITLLMVFYWSKYFFVKPKLKYLLLFAIFGALAAYNHYFSLLFAATVGISGLMLVNKKTILPYILSGVLILILYVPHLEIIFAQAEKGTIGGWLGEPGPWFMANFGYWLFHKSIVSVGLFVTIFLAGVYFSKPYGDKVELKLKKRLILLLWLLPAPIFGYIYSYTKEPILQNSLLIFTAPYFFMWVFSFVGKLDWKKLTVAILLILLVNSLTLIYVRDYYKIFYKQPFRNVAQSAMSLEEQFSGEVIILNDYIPYYTDYYFNDSQEKIPFITTRNANLSLLEFDSIVEAIDQSVVITSGLNDQYFQIVKKHFPYWLDFDSGFTFEQYTLSKNKPDGFEVLENTPIAFTDFKNSTGNWKFSDKNVKYDSISASYFYDFISEMEWGPKCSFNLDSVKGSPYLIIDVEIEIVSLTDGCETVLVAEIKQGSNLLSWSGFDFKDFNFEKGQSENFFATVDLQKTLNNQMDIPGATMTIYLWNPKQSDLELRDIEISSRQGNPDRYNL